MTRVKENLSSSELGLCALMGVPDKEENVPRLAPACLIIGSAARSLAEA